MFLLGEKGYKCIGRNDMGEPNDYLFCWESEIIPYIKENPKKFKDIFFNALHELFFYKKDKILGIYSVANHVFWCSYFINKASINLDIDLTEIINELSIIVDLNKDALRKDKRWAGAEWNSNNGLLEPIRRLLSRIVT